MKSGTAMTTVGKGRWPLDGLVGTGDATGEYIMLAREGAHGMEMRVTINDRETGRGSQHERRTAIRSWRTRSVGTELAATEATGM